MRIISNKAIEEPKQEMPKQEETKEEVKKEECFNDILVDELGKEYYGVNFFGSLGILSKGIGLCDNAKFFWKIAECTMEIKLKIKKFLLQDEHMFVYPAIPKPDINETECLFCQALDYENNRIEELYKTMEKAPCDCTKALIGKLIKKHSEIQHLLSLAHKISEMSEDKLLVQQSVYKLISQ